MLKIFVLLGRIVFLTDSKTTFVSRDNQLCTSRISANWILGDTFKSSGIIWKENCVKNSKVPDKFDGKTLESLRDCHSTNPISIFDLIFIVVVNWLAVLCPEYIRRRFTLNDALKPSSLSTYDCNVLERLEQKSL